MREPPLVLKGSKFDPVAELVRVKSDYETICGKFRDQQYRLLARVNKINAKFGKREADWDRFCKDSFWDDLRVRPGAYSRQGGLKFCMQFFLGAKSESARKKASKYAKALSALKSSGSSIEAIAATIKERGGIAKLAREAASTNKKPEKSTKDASPSTAKQEKKSPSEKNNSSNNTSQKGKKGQEERQPVSNGFELKFKPISNGIIERSTPGDKVILKATIRNDGNIKRIVVFSVKVLPKEDLHPSW